MYLHSSLRKAQEIRPPYAKFRVLPLETISVLAGAELLASMMVERSDSFHGVCLRRKIQLKFYLVEPFLLSCPKGIRGLVCEFFLPILLMKSPYTVLVATCKHAKLFPAINLYVYKFGRRVHNKGITVHDFNAVTRMLFVGCSAR